VRLRWGRRRGLRVARVERSSKRAHGDAWLSNWRWATALGYTSTQVGWVSAAGVYYGECERKAAVDTMMNASDLECAPFSLSDKLAVLAYRPVFSCERSEYAVVDSKETQRR
jgi:hypothetical protein